MFVFFREPEDSDEEGEDPALDSLSQAIAFQVSWFYTLYNSVTVNITIK